MTAQTSLFPSPAAAAVPEGLWMLELAGPAAWPVTRAVWESVQEQWGWPAPAISVNGRDGYQLWFRLPLAWPMSSADAPQAQACGEAMAEAEPGPGPAGRLLQALQALALKAGAMAPNRGAPVRWAMQPVCGQGQGQGQGQALPPHEVAAEQWAAFVTRDLAPIFADTPWLDLCPGLGAQAEHLARLPMVPEVAWSAALQLAPQGQPAQGQPAPGSASGWPDPQGLSRQGPGAIPRVPPDVAFHAASAAAAAAVPERQAEPALSSPPGLAKASWPCATGAGGVVTQEEGPGSDPLSHARLAAAAWLLTVMHDDTQPMAHRLEAARLLLAR